MRTQTATLSSALSGQFEPINKLGISSPMGTLARSDSQQDQTDEPARPLSRSVHRDNFFIYYRDGDWEAKGLPEKWIDDSSDNLTLESLSIDSSQYFLEPPKPLNEKERLAELHELSPFDIKYKGHFDAIVSLVKSYLGVETSLISLVDDEEQRFLARMGLEACSTGRDVSFCGHVILRRTQEAVHVRDATADWRFRNNPLVTGAPNIRFYVGSPLRSSRGLNIGTLCALGPQVRDLSEKESNVLELLAGVVIRLIEDGRRTQILDIQDFPQTLSSLQQVRLLDGDVSNGTLINFANPPPATCKSLGITAEAAVLAFGANQVDFIVNLPFGKGTRNIFSWRSERLVSDEWLQTLDERVAQENKPVVYADAKLNIFYVGTPLYPNGCQGPIGLLRLSGPGAAPSLAAEWIQFLASAAVAQLEGGISTLLLESAQTMHVSMAALLAKPINADDVHRAAQTLTKWVAEGCVLWDCAFVADASGRLIQIGFNVESGVTLTTVYPDEPPALTPGQMQEAVQNEFSAIGFEHGSSSPLLFQALQLNSKDGVALVAKIPDSIGSNVWGFVGVAKSGCIPPAHSDLAAAFLLDMIQAFDEILSGKCIHRSSSGEVGLMAGLNSDDDE